MLRIALDRSLVPLLVAFGALVAPAGALDGAIFNVVEHRDLDYIATEDYADNKDKLDLFLPEGLTNAPVVVYFHGGALQNGTKTIGEGLGKQLAARASAWSRRTTASPPT